jgi:hypothetical protein
MQDSSHLTIILCSSVIKIVNSQKQPFRLRDARVVGSIPTQGEIKKKGYILSRDSEVTLSHWSRTIILCSSVIKIVISQKQKFNRKNNNYYYYYFCFPRK